MPRTPEDEDFLLQRAALAPLAEPPEELAPLPEDEEALLPTEPDDYMALPPAAAPKVAPLQPKDPYGQGADRAALEAAIKDRASTDNSARFMDAIESFNHAGGGTAKDLGASTRARRDDSFNDVMRRRALADQDAAAGKRQRDQDLDEAMRDPGSDVSVRARALFSGTTVGRALRERMGDRFESLSASQLPGARDIISSETDLLKAQAKASNAGSDEISATMEALAQRADEKFPGQGFGDKIRKYGHDAKGLAAARDVVHQDVGQKFSKEEAEKGRTNTTATRLEDERVRQDDKRLSRLQSLGNAIKPEEASVLKIVKDLVNTVQANTNPETGDIAGVGPGHTVVQGVQDMVPGIVGTGIDAMKSQPAQDVQHALTLAYSLERKGITGVVFTPRENAEYKLALNNISNGHNVQASVKRLVELSEQAVNRLYAAHPDTWRQYVKANPNMATSMFNEARPEDPTEVAPAMNPPSSGTTGARGINPAGFTPPPALPTKDEVVAPDRYNIDLNAPPKAKAVPVSKEPPAQKPGKVTMQLKDGRFLYADPGKVEWVKAKFPGAQHIKYDIKK